MDLEAQIEEFRLELVRIVRDEEMTIREICRKTGVKQPQLSRFLNKKGKISNKRIDHMARVLKIGPFWVRPQPLPNPKGESIPLIDRQLAISVPVVTGDLALRSVGYTNLLNITSDPAVGLRSNWTRFVAIELSTEQALFMRPLLGKTSIVVLDRHNQQVNLESRGANTIYAISYGQTLLLGYLKKVGTQLQLHPDNRTADPIPVRLPPDREAIHAVVGRVVKIINDPPDLKPG